METPIGLMVAYQTVSLNLTDAASTNLSMGSLFDLLDNLPDQDNNHNGGHLVFGLDGMLYAGLGDDTAAFAPACIAQDPNVLAGKILRIDVSGVRGQVGAGPPAQSAITPAGNPFSGMNAQLVWALGLRNPFSIAKDPLLGTLYCGDVGLFTTEELNDITQPGQNFGWPWFEGNLNFPQTGCAAPANPVFAAYSYPGSLQGVNQNAAIMVGPVYRNTGAIYDFGATYEGSLFIMDERRSFLRRLVPGGGGWVVAPPVSGQGPGSDWGAGLNRPSGLIRGADGAIYYTSAFAPRGLFRVRPAGSGAVTVSSGNNQVGNAGQLLSLPLEVQATGAQGTPLIGAPVTFSLTQGSGVLASASAVTDQNGNASTTLVLSTTDSTDPVVQAQVGSLPVVTFNATWRGLLASLGSGQVTIDVIHSQTSAPFTLALDLPQPVSVPTPFGPIVTSVLSPGPTLIALDGLGLLGPPDGITLTGATNPTWTSTVSLPPTGGLQVVLQAYGVDTNLFPANASVFISQPQSLLIP